MSDERRKRKREVEERKNGTPHVTVLALVAALRTFSAPCTAGSIRSSRSRPFSGFMMTGLAVWMSAVQPWRASSNEEGSVRSACCCFFGRDGEEGSCPLSRAKRQLKREEKRNEMLPLFFSSSLSLSFITLLTLNSFSFSFAPGSAHRCAFLATLEGSRTVPRTEWPAASRRATIDDAK